jgi:peptide/nickel transport system permease protein
MTMATAAVLLAIVGAAVFAPWLAPADPYKTSMIRRLLPVGSTGFALGTDELGRDMISRLLYGGRLSLWMGVMPVLVAFVAGTAIGLVAGYVGGWFNMAIMRTLDVFYAFPSVLLAVAISGALGPGMSNSMLALTVVFVPQVVRIAESVTTQVRRLDYVDAARMSGAGALSIIRVHVLGNVLGPVFVYATGLVSVSMILASGLSFLGLGVKPPEPEWGLMLNTLRSAIYLNPWVAALPGAMIFITSIAFNLLADGVRSAMEIHR